MSDSDEKTWLDVEREATGRATIRAAPNSISLHPIDEDGEVWELTARNDDGDEVAIRVSDEDGTFGELTAEFDGV